MPDDAKSPKPDVPKRELPLDLPWVTTEHSIGDLKYTATAGMIPLRDENGQARAGIFFVAYQRAGDFDPAQRPLTFSFNGGPGSSSVWLHLGAVGPKRVALEADGAMPAPPYRLEDNPQTWLEHTDLVFIDPIGTGYSRAVKAEDDEKYWGLDADLDSVAEFIRRYLSRAKRWASPLCMVGESYGTTRAAGLSSRLVEKGVALSGVILVSSILNFQTARFTKGNDLPYVLFLPSYTATSWFHGCLPHFSRLEEALREAETYALGDYTLALAQGDRLSPEARQEVIARLGRLTGLSPAYLDATDLRINIHRYCKELLRTQKRTVGRLDSRFKGIDEIAATENPQHDPSMSALTPPYTAAINDWLGRGLGWESDEPYHVFAPGELWKKWTYGDANGGFPDTSEALRSALAKNPHMRVFVASGYYDLATPYFATEYTLSHLGLDPTLRENIRTGYYPAGHMMYIDEGCLARLNGDVAEFLGGAQK
jgi:carboxypeptidase C (cathepsin A)